MTDGRASFGALLAQFGDVAAQARRVLDDHRAQLGALLARAEEVARTVADPEAAAFEVEQVQRETNVRIAEAQSAQASAERDAREARRRAEQEAEQRAQADDAAETALRELETVGGGAQSLIWFFKGGPGPSPATASCCRGWPG